MRHRLLLVARTVALVLIAAVAHAATAPTCCRWATAPSRSSTRVRARPARSRAPLPTSKRACDSERDWGHAEDYVRAMHLMLQQDEPDDYVIATGHSFTVRTFVEKVFGHLDLEESYVKIDPRHYRPAEVAALRGDAAKARTRLGWEPRVGIDELVRRMVEHDLELARQDRILRDAGHAIAARGIAGA